MMDFKYMENLPDGSLTQGEVRALIRTIRQMDVRIRTHDLIVAALVMSVPGKRIRVPAKNMASADARNLMYSKSPTSDFEEIWYEDV